MTPPGVLCSGNIVLDLLVRPVDEMRWGASLWVDPIERSLGGNGSNTAYTVAMLGVPARLLGAVGHDDSGDEVLARLLAAGVDTSRVWRSQAATASTVVLVNSYGERLFLHHPGASLEVFGEPIEFTAEVVEGMAHYHLGSPFALPRQRPFLTQTLRRAQEAGLTTSLDTQWDSRGRWLDDLAPALPYIDILFMNEDEARMLTGTADADPAARFMLERGARTVVMKLGGRGCAVFGEGGPVHQPAFDVPVVDTTGAGDCYAGGYLSALQRAASHAEAARFATGVAALVVQRLGAVAGLAGYAETLSRIQGLSLKPAL